MRIFISLIDESGTKRTTRINVSNCTTTTILIKEICKEIKMSKSNVIIKMKYEPQNVQLLGYSFDWFKIGLLNNTLSKTGPCLSLTLSRPIRERRVLTIQKVYKKFRKNLMTLSKKRQQAN
jgi:hypothetical protein